MLKDEQGRKPREIEITQKKWNEAKNIIREGIKKKLDAAKSLLKQIKKFQQVFTFTLWKNLENCCYSIIVN